ncbi:uncharacterized protein [Ambystoma mexicanum]|uniref:uncharacterized protein n=1 Tax=Ambystoma mexicanum TaxID=8296 RepID=UPI0037E98AC9
MAQPRLMRLALIVVLVSAAWSQPTLQTDAILVDCVESLSRIILNAQQFMDKDVRFSVLDQYGRAFEVTRTLATKCGYTITRDFWGNIEFRASIISCYSQIVDESSYSLTVKLDVSSTMAASVSYIQILTCPFYPWSAREILCETNYMEVSVVRTVPLASEGYIGDQPEDWAAAFPDAVSGEAFVWQIVFRLPSRRKTMPLKAAQDAGYGINTTNSRIVLRAAYNATETTVESIESVDFSVLRTTTYYKQRWMLFMIDTAVACPVDDVKYTAAAILWSIPRTIPPLLAGANNIQASSGMFGIDLQALSDGDLRNRFVIQNDSRATTIQIPVGEPSGYYKSHVVNGKHGITYSISIFLQNQWTDDKWGQTRQTIVKDLTTPFMPRPPIVTNNTIPATRVFNVSVGTFLPDVVLQFVTIGITTLSVAQANARGYVVSEFRYANGSASYTLKVPFDDPSIHLQVIGSFRVYTLNATFGFKVIPENRPFSVPVEIVAVQDIVLPSTTGYCDDSYLHLVVRRGNVDEDWAPYVGNLLLNSQSAEMHGFLLLDNGTHFEIKVQRASPLVTYEVRTRAIAVTIPISLKDRAGNTRSNFSIACNYKIQDKMDCLLNGTIVITAVRNALVQGMDLSKLVLRDRSCKPTVLTDLSATFVFNANTCGTTSRFTGSTMTYENNVLYYSSGVAAAIYNMTISCNYGINGTALLSFRAEDIPLPTAEHGFGSLALVMRLSKDPSYVNFYSAQEYPVLKYLQEPLYFEVEIQYTQDPQIELFLHDCWATSSADRFGTPKWDIVVNSCPNTADHYETIFHPVTMDSRVRLPSHLKRFEVKTFTFRQNAKGQIYFHCSVVICNSALPLSDLLCRRLCIPDRQRIGRSVDAHLDVHGYVSSGMVQILA